MNAVSGDVSQFEALRAPKAKEEKGCDHSHSHNEH